VEAESQSSAEDARFLNSIGIATAE